MDYNGVQSYRSNSSTNVPTQVHDAHGAGSSIEQSEFVNHGLIFWNRSRQKWRREKNASSRSQRLRARKASYATYDSCLRSNEPLPKPIPLGEMVAFLVDIWEPGGGYD